MKIYHCTDSTDWAPHIGACFANIEMTRFGDATYVARLDRDSLNVVNYEYEEGELRQRYDNDNWPADTAAELEAFRAAGVDVLAYDDCDDNGGTMTTYRIISDAALACIAASVSMDDH